METTNSKTAPIVQEKDQNQVTLAFKSGGDTQQAKITKGIYRYCGVDIPAACSSWLSAKVNDDGTVSFTAKANHDGADRKVTVNCWVSSVKAPEDGEKELLPVTITQPASYDYEIESVGIIMHAVVWQSQVSFKASDEGVTITPTDKGVSVTFRQSGRDTGANAEWESLIKFSVDDLSLFESKQATLTNFSYEMNRKGGEYNYYGDHVDWTKSTISMSANTSVMQSASGAWYMSTDNLSYHSNSTIHYDKWRKDAYSPPTEHTYTETVSEPYQGTSVSVFLSVKKK